MMNKRIRSMIDDIFKEMKMTAENLALRDEMMANVQARYEDSIAAGKTEEEAFSEVAASLGDVQELLAQMNGEAPQQEPQAREQVKADPKIEVKINLTDEPFEDDEEDEEDEEDEVDEEDEEDEEDEVDEEDEEDEEDEVDEEDEEDEVDEEENGAAQQDAQTELNLGDALNKAFSALGDFGKSIMPQAKKLVRDMDDATGGAIKSFGRALGDSVKTAQKAAGDAIDRMGDNGEIVIDLTKPIGAKKGEQTGEKTAEALREEAADLRAQAQIKLAVGDQESADALLAQADALCTQADALEQAEAIAEAQAEAAQESNQESAEASEPEEGSEAPKDEFYGADGELDEKAFSRAVEDMMHDAEEAIRQASDVVKKANESFEKTGEEIKKTVKETVKGNPEVTVSGSMTFPVAGLRKVDIQLDADDVYIEPAEDNEIVVRWEGHGGDPDVRMENHKLIIRHKNPDVFKTFFSFFKKDGCEFHIRVPLGYAADYAVSTTSGDIRLSGVDVDNVKLGTTSGDMRIEPDLAIRAKKVEAETVSGDVTVSARCEDVAVSSVSGDQFISCDAVKVSAHAVSGDVHVEGACDEWEIETVNSEVELLCTVAPTKKMDISSVNGDAHVALPGDIRGFVAEMSSVNGDIENEFGPNRYGTCALPIHMDTVNGQLVITRL